MPNKCDFSGWATRYDYHCADGRVIMKDAFKHNDGKRVSLVYNHDHEHIDGVLGHACLEARPEGIYAYCYLNDTEQGEQARKILNHGDIASLSIYANSLKQKRNEVYHGEIRELSLVLAGANSGAYIDFVSENIAHSDEGESMEDAFFASYDERIMIHSATEESAPEKEKKDEEVKMENNDNTEKTIGEIIDGMTDEQADAVNTVIGAVIDALTSDDDDEDETNEEGENEDMKHNVFENDTNNQEMYLSHSAEQEIIEMAKTSSVGTLQGAIKRYAAENDLQHDAFEPEVMDTLLPEYQLLDPKAPPILYPDDTWVASVINGVHKSPVARVRTRRADARQAELKGLGYKKGTLKKLMPQIELLSRTHDPQTIYVKDKLNRDDILDITDFDVVEYSYQIMRHTLDQTLAEAILIGDNREAYDPDKIKEDKIRPIWTDNDLYTIHTDVDFDAAANALQGTDTGVHFGENYIWAEAIISAALYAREQYKGSGNLTFYCTPHTLNVMLLARDLNGRRIYTSKNDLVAALNVANIQTVEQFENRTRVTADGKTKKLLGLFVNLRDYQLGCVKGGEITKFQQFDIDFNQEKLLLETRCSGALVEWYSAIALEEDITE